VVGTDNNRASRSRAVAPTRWDTRLNERIARLNRLTSDIEFSREDAEILDLVLNIRPELRVCAEAVRQARRVGLQYPITSVAGFLQGLGPRPFPGIAVEIKDDDIRRLFPAEWFPIDDEVDLVMRIYLAIQRCQYEMTSELHEPGPAAENERGVRR